MPVYQYIMLCLCDKFPQLTEAQNLKKTGLFMKNLSQYLCKTCHGTDNSVHSKVSKFAIAFSCLAIDLSYYIFSKNTKCNCSLLFSSAYVSTWCMYFYIQMWL